MIAAGLPAIATDYNRFHPSGNMNFVVATALK
jgi:hypothetical protein